MRKICIRHKILIGIELLFVLVRCFFGVELTDETYYIGNANLLLEGGIPFVNMWMVQDGSMLMYSWILGIYKFFVPSLEGCFLYMRLMSVVFRIMIICIAYRILLRHIGEKISIYCVLALIPFSTELPTFSYNILAFYMLFLAGMLAMNNLLVCKKAFCSWFIIGIIIALTIYSHPSTILSVFWFAVLSLYSSYKYASNSFWGYLLGGISATILVVVWMIVRAKGIETFLLGLQAMKTAAYFDMEKPSIFEQIEWLNKFVKMDIVNLAVVFAGVWLLCTIWKSIDRNRKDTRENIIKLFYIFALYTWFIVTIWYNVYNINIWQLILKIGEVIAIFTFVALIFWRNKKIYVYSYLGITIPSTLFFFVNGFFSIQGPVNRLIIFIPCIVLCIISFYHMQEIFNKKITRIMLGIFIASVVIAEFRFNYGYVYRDEEISELSVQMTDGVYRGLFTTLHRSRDLEKMQQVLSMHVEPEENVLFMDTFALGYLMTEAKVCAPSSYEMITPIYNVTNPECMYLYFDMMDVIPNQVIYARTERNTNISIEMNDEYFPFNYYVKENYIFDEAIKVGQDFEFLFYKLK